MTDDNFDLHNGDEIAPPRNVLSPDRGRAATMISVSCSILQLPIRGAPISCRDSLRRIYQATQDMSYIFRKQKAP